MKKFGFFFVFLMFVFSATFVKDVCPGVYRGADWIIIQQVATDMTGDISVDEDQNGKVDHTDANLTEILENGNVSQLSMQVKDVFANHYYLSSDLRLKKNINTIQNPLSIVNKLRGVNFQWKDSNEQDIGLIAQDVEGILPEVVTDKGGYKAIEYSNIVAILIEAIKEQQKQIYRLEQEIDTLKNRIH